MTLMICKKCFQNVAPESGKVIETTTNESYFFCRPCLKNATKQLSMKKNKTIDDEKLLKDLRKYLGEQTN